MTSEQRPSAANTQEDLVPHSGKAGYEYPLARHDDGVDLTEEVAKELPEADTRNFQPTTDELELIRIHREERTKHEADQHSTEQNKFLAFLKKPIGKVAVTGAGLSLALAAGIGIGGSMSDNDKVAPTDTSTSGPEKPGQNADNVPAEAREFVDTYGAMFNNPVATYYAEQAYITEYNLPTVIDQPYIDSYVMTDNITQEASDMGFWRTYIPLDKPIDKQTVATFVNDMVIPSCLDRYINLAAKNPLPEAAAIIDNEFLKYCGGIGPASLAPGSDNTENTLQLMATLKAITDKYGSEANYKIAPASLDEADAETATVINAEPEIDSVNESNFITNFDTLITLKVDVDVYDDKNQVTTQKESVELRLTVARVTPTGPVDPGRVIIGQE